jgi:lipopolysaccharide transport system ATP-binding protein
MSYLRTRSLGKAYKRYAHKSGRLREWFGLGIQHELTWVLRDVSIDVAPGEAVGIVGANGAGKSTLLKIIAGTVHPTTGAFEIGGRVAALLELGVGFHPEFTGRQNAYMAGQLLGISASETAALMGDVAAFAEIGEYLDQPVRTYSSGMQMRLAFSVATAVRPDILIVDEALSVGDAYFQHKSFDRIRRFRDLGTTLLFVSHSPGAVKTLCSRALLLDHGLLVRDDSPDAVLDYYNAMIAAQHTDYEIRQTDTAPGRTATRSGTAEATIESIEIMACGEQATVVRSGDAAVIRVLLAVHQPLADLTVGMLIRDRLGNDVFGTNTFHLGASLAAVPAGARMAVEFAMPRLSLGIGSYSVTAALHAGDRHTAANFDWWDRALVFQVVSGRHPLCVGVCVLDVAVRWLSVDPAWGRERGWEATTTVGTAPASDGGAPTPNETMFVGGGRS